MIFFFIDLLKNLFQMDILIHIPMLKKSLITATVVGVILTGLNQGDVILYGPVSTNLLWKIPLTFFVPFCVATFSALANTRR